MRNSSINPPVRPVLRTAVGCTPPPVEILPLGQNMENTHFFERPKDYIDKNLPQLEMIHPCININSHVQQQINIQQLQYPSHFKSESSTMKSTFRILSNHQHDVSFCHQNSPLSFTLSSPLKPKNCPPVVFWKPPSPDSKSLPENRSKCPKPDSKSPLKDESYENYPLVFPLLAWILGFTTLTLLFQREEFML